MTCRATGGRGLAQLAVLAAAAVDAAGDRPRIAFRLALDAGPDAGHRLPPALGDGRAAIVAFAGAFAARHAEPGQLDRVLDRVVDLILHRAVPRPAASHGKKPFIFEP